LLVPASAARSYAIMTKRDVLPSSLPPRGLSRVVAAAYIGVSVSFFDILVADGRMPQPKRINSRKLWDRLALDAAFEALPDDDEPDSWADVSVNADQMRNQLPATRPQELARRATSSGAPFEMPGPEYFEKLWASGRPVLAEGNLWSRDDWNAHVRAKPLSKLERNALRAMGPYGIDHVFPWGERTGGPVTMDRLLAREYVVIAVDRGADRTPDYRLTDAGLEAYRQLPASE
jgi:hypothetical protein